jgi:hypothetical protein
MPWRACGRRDGSRPPSHCAARPGPGNIPGDHPWLTQARPLAGRRRRVDRSVTIRGSAGAIAKNHGKGKQCQPRMVWIVLDRAVCSLGATPPLDVRQPRRRAPPCIALAGDRVIFRESPGLCLGNGGSETRQRAASSRSSLARGWSTRFSVGTSARRRATPPGARRFSAMGAAAASLRVACGDQAAALGPHAHHRAPRMRPWHERRRPRPRLRPCLCGTSLPLRRAGSNVPRASLRAHKIAIAPDSPPPCPEG